MPFYQGIVLQSNWFLVGAEIFGVLFCMVIIGEVNLILSSIVQNDLTETWNGFD